MIGDIMRENDFKKLDAKKKAEFINANLSAGKSFKDIYDATMQNHEFAQSRENLINQFKEAGYIIDRQDAERKQIEKPVIKSESSEPNKVLVEEYENFEKILESADEIMQMLKWWRLNNVRVPAVIDGLKVEIPSGDELRKTIRINAQIWGEWKAFCGKHPDFSEKDLLAKAILLYINTEP
jgi:hypothetical protein